MGDLAVERERGFQRDERKPGSNPQREIFVERRRYLLRVRRRVPRFRRALKLGEAAAGDGGIRVVHRGDDAFHAGGDDGFGAGPVRPVVQQGSSVT